MELRKLFSRENIVKALKSPGALRIRVSHSSLMAISLLLLILFLAFMVRLLPLRWGFYLSEFDPCFQYRLTDHMVQNGFLSYNTWHDYMSWYPYGRDVAHTAFPGLAFTAASFYYIARALAMPITVYQLCVLFPVIMGTITCLVIYFVGKDIGGKEVGLFAAFFLALSSSYIGRTSLGFFDDETVGIFGILLLIFFFLRSIEPERSMKACLAYAIAGGLSLGYLFASWGASRYAVGIIVLYVFVLLLLRRYSSRLLWSYSVTFGIALFIAVNIPYIGFTFLKESSILLVFGMFLLLCAFELVRYFRTLKMKTLFFFGFFALLVAGLFALSWLGFIKGMEAKFMSVINPYERIGRALVESVQEHRPAAWGSFYYDLGIGAFFVPIGLFFAIQNPTNRNIFLAIFGLTSIYFAGSMSRLTLLMAPAFALLWALGIVRLVRPFITLLREVPAIPMRKMRFEGHVGKEFSGAFLILVIFLLTFAFVLPNPQYPRVFEHAYVPTTLATASMPIKPESTVPDWISTLDWMRINLTVWEQQTGQTAVICSWWDYGYWITTFGNKPSLADNATFNKTQIENIALVYMTNMTAAVKILKKFKTPSQPPPTHILVFVTFQVDSQGNIGDVGWGDEGKWRWMARIAHERYPWVNETEMGRYDENGNWADWSDEIPDDGKTQGKETVIYKLMQYGKEKMAMGYSTVQIAPYFTEAYFSQTPLQPRNYGGAYPLVAVYKIDYPTT